MVFEREPEVKHAAGRGNASFACVALAAALLAGCGEGDDASDGPGFTPLSTMGMLGVPSPTLLGQNLMLVDVTLDGHSGGRLLVDTGSPFTIVNGELFAGLMLPAQTQVTTDIGVGELTIDRVPALQATGANMDQLRLAGILGGNVLRQFSTTLNYRDRQLQLGAGALPDGVAESTRVNFELSGGGFALLNGQVITVPKTRVPITAEIEGKKHHFVLDTGASDIALRVSVFDALLDDGRASIDDMPISTVSGSSSARATRARSITLSGQTLANVPVIAFDDSIEDSISSELGYTVDGMFGGDFLREFLVTIDYPHGAVELRRYATRDHVVDDFQRVGLWLVASGATGFLVGAIHAGSDAELRGIASGDEVLAIDGQTLAGLDLITSDALLNGSVGQSHRLRLGRTRSASLAQTEVEIAIEDLIPAPN